MVKGTNSQVAFSGVDASTTYGKNAIINGKNVSLTGGFGGTYKAEAGSTVDGGNVEKNLTFKGTKSAETFYGGGNSKKKATFKGGGGDDKFIGGASKDIFTYSKGEAGNITVANFDYKNDKLKIASGTITRISSLEGGVRFSMNKGKNSADIATLTINSDTTGYKKNADDTKIDPSNVLIKANNTYYWFAQEEIKEKTTDGTTGATLAEIGDLVTSDSRLKSSDIAGYSVIELGYSTNLVNSGLATKITGVPKTISSTPTTESQSTT